MIVVGVSILGNLNKQATSQQSLGLSFWQIVISSGIVVTILGFVNIIASFVFRNPSLGVTARMIRAYGAVAPQKVDDVLSRSNTSRRRRSFHLGRSDTLPSYYSSPKTETRQKSPMNISRPVNTDTDQFAKFSGTPEVVTKPDPAQHPAFVGGRI